MTIEELKSRRVGILGFGQEGQAVAAYLLRHGVKPVLFDKRPIKQFSNDEQTLIRERQLEIYFGPDYLEHLTGLEVIFRSPGLWRLHPLLLQAEEQGAIITSQVRWFFEHCAVPIIGVTGTKGKGTTASLIAHIFQTAGRPVYLTGNVGQVQPLDFLDEIRPEDTIVYELSSFQLQDLRQSPQIAVVLMVTTDHLDVHASVEEYHQAKSAITKFQTGSDTAIINDDYPASQDIGRLGAGKKLFYSRRHKVTNGAFVVPISPGSALTLTLPPTTADLVIAEQGTERQRFDLSVLPLRGRHNWDNAAAAVLAGLTAGISAAVITQALPTFRGLPHRLQRLPERAGIQFYDDSISTVPDTAAAGIRSFTEPVILLIGGSDKGLDPALLIEAILAAPQIKAVVCLGATGPRLAQLLQQHGFARPILQGFANLEAAMRAVKTKAQSGDVVLLSPGFASFDWYDNYKQRGDDFARLAADWENLRE